MIAFLKFLTRKVTGREMTIASITSPMTKILRDLETFAVEQASKAVDHREEADKLHSQARDADAAAVDASKIAKVYKSLVLPSTI